MMYKSYDRKFGKYPFFSMATVVLLLIVSMLATGCAAIQPGLPGVAQASVPLAKAVAPVVQAAAPAVDPGVADKVMLEMVSPGEIKQAVEFVRMSSNTVATYSKPGVGTVMSWMKDGKQVFLFILENSGVKRILPNGLMAGLDRIQGMKDMLAQDGWKPAVVAPNLLLWIEVAASSMTSVWMMPIAPTFNIDEFLQGEQIQS